MLYFVYISCVHFYTDLSENAVMCNKLQKVIFITESHWIIWLNGRRSSRCILDCSTTDKQRSSSYRLRQDSSSAYSQVERKKKEVKL